MNILIRMSSLLCIVAAIGLMVVATIESSLELATLAVPLYLASLVHDSVQDIKEKLDELKG